ncbi:MFS transporter [Micromonospora sp. NPDC023633]|uniref:MFS transporter n=1 Tax=Micromonospora sp. NPDC023633 TaxID=3154320 RepID=UPI0034043681
MADSRVVSSVRSWAGGLVPERGTARTLALLTMVQAVGFGLFLSASTIFLRRSVGLSAGEVGVGLSVAGLAGLLLTVPIGRAADRWGARLPLVTVYALLAVLFAGYTMVSGLVSFVLIASAISICETSSTPLRMTLTYEAFEPAARVRVSAQMRSFFNVGIVFGAAMASVAVAMNSREAFVAVMVVTAACHAGCALIAARVPARRPQVSSDGRDPVRSRSGLRDLRFVSLALLCGVLELYQPILTVGLPLWIMDHTEAPTSVYSILLILNTVLVIALQVVASRAAETATGAAALLRRAGLLLALGCLVFAFSEATSPMVAVPLLLLGTAVLVWGEISQAAGSWGVSLHLPPPGRQGDYQGVFALGRGLQQTVGPFLVATVVVSNGQPGWWGLAALFVLAGVACPPLTRAAQNRRSDLALAGR